MRQSASFRAIISCLCLWLFCALGRLSAQALYKDKMAMASISQGLDFLYGNRLDQADSCLRRLLPRYARHPGIVIFQSMELYWKYYPILLYPKEYERYKSLVQESINLAEGILKKNEDDPEAIFFAMMGYSVLARHAADEEQSMHAVTMARKSFPYMKQGFGLKKEYPEFYFSTGLYNYYRERYPEDHPIYKPFLIFFPSGDKAKGIADMEAASQLAHFTKTEALTFLSIMMLHFELQPVRALGYTTQLTQRYPANLIYRLFHIEALMHCNRFAETIPLLKSMANGQNIFYKAAHASLQGWWLERNGQAEKAEEFYRYALTISKNVKKYNDIHKGYSYAGLARIAAARGDKHKAKKYFKLAVDVSHSQLIKNEARKY